MTSNFGGFPNIGQPGQMGPPQIPWKLVFIWGGGIGFVVGILALTAWFLSIFTNFLWFDNLGYGDVYKTILIQRIWLFFVARCSLRLLPASTSGSPTSTAEGHRSYPSLKRPWSCCGL